MASWARPDRLVPAAILLASLGVYWSTNAGRLGEQSFWTDELFSVSQANLDLIAMLKLQAADNHPPFYAMFIWAWIRLTHDGSEAIIRLPSLVAIAAGIGILALATWRRVGVGAAAVVLVLATTSSLVASFTFEARMHGLAFGLVCVATAAWLQLLGRPAPSRWLLVTFAVTGGLGALTQYYALVTYVLAAGVLGLWLAAAGLRREAAAVAVAVGVSLLPVLTWLGVTLRLLNASGTPPLTMSWADDVFATSASPFSESVFGPVTDERHGVGLVVVVGLVATILLAVGWLARRRAADGVPARDRLAIGGAALGIGFGAIALGTIESLVAMPTLHYRSMMGVLPVMYVGLGLAVTAPFGRHGWAAGAVAAAALLAVAATTPTPPLYTKDDWRGAAQIVRQQRLAGLPADRIVLVAPWNQREWLVELNNVYGRRAPVTDTPSELAGLRWIAAAPDLGAVPPQGPILLVAFHFWRSDAHDAILAAARDRFGPCSDQSVTGITILRCAGDAAARQ